MYFPLYEFSFTVLAGLATSLFSGLLVRYVRKLRAPKGETIQDRVARLTHSLEEATSLIANIEEEVKARSSLVTQLQNDVDRYNKLVEIKRPEVEAIAQLLRGELKREGRASFWKSFAVNFIFFILGAGVSLAITLLTKPSPGLTSP